MQSTLLRLTPRGLLLLALAFAGCSSNGGSIDGGLDPGVDLGRVYNLSGDRSGIGTACKEARGGAPRGTCTGDEQVCLLDGRLGFNGGYCSQDCVSTGCPDDADCVSLAPGYDLCLARCNSDADCRGPDYVCSDYNACVPKNGFYLGGEVRPATKDGEACVTPVVAAPGTSTFEANQQLSIVSGGEVSVAVDHAGINVVTAWINLYGTPRIGVASSQDGGATFSTPLFLPADDDVDINDTQSDPVVAVDSQGNFFITWIGFNAATGRKFTTYVARSTDGGLTFPDLFVASPPSEFKVGQFLDKPWIAVGPDDSIYVSWAAGTSANSEPVMRVTRSTDAGETWSAPVTATPNDTVFHNLGQVAVSADGTVYVSCLEADGDLFGDSKNKVVLQRLTPDLQLDGPRIVLSGGTDSPSFDPPALAVHGDEVYVAFASGSVHGDWDLRVVASPDRGVTVQPSVKVNDDATCATHFHPAAAVDDDGLLHVVFYDNRYLDGNLFHTVAAAPAGGTALTFRPNEFVNDTSFPFTTERDASGWLGDYPAVAATGGIVYVAWTDARLNTTSQVYFARKGNGQ